MCWEWGFTGQAHLLGDKLIINERSRVGGDKYIGLHVINPKKEYPHPIHYLIEPEPMDVHPDNVRMAHDSYLGAEWRR